MANLSKRFILFTFTIVCIISVFVKSINALVKISPVKNQYRHLNRPSAAPPFRHAPVSSSVGSFPSHNQSEINAPATTTPECNALKQEYEKLKNDFQKLETEKKDLEERVQDLAEKTNVEPLTTFLERRESILKLEIESFKENIMKIEDEIEEDKEFFKILDVAYNQVTQGKSYKEKKEGVEQALFIEKHPFS